MHTKISSDNPYGYNRFGFAWECVSRAADAHLDFGCCTGVFLNSLKDKQIRRLVGVDVCEGAVKKGQCLFPDLEIIKIREAAGLPFDDGTFNSVTILDVLEHVYEQTQLLAELNRVLKDGGEMIVTVPGQHFFSFLDMGNLKFRFPKLHRWYYCLRHSPEEYEYRYVSNPDGLIGDVSAKKRWHEHFSREKLRKLLTEAGFSIVDFDGAGFFSRVIGNIDQFLRWLKPVHKALTKLQNLDYRLFESANLFCIAEKCRAAKIVN
jgi:ubiquinone/menaquinone biosynthesis C-methylase UbiE